MIGGDRIKFTRSRIAKAISKEFDIPYRIAADITAEIFEIIKREVSAENEVQISGFGKFILKRRRPKKARDWKSGSGMEMPAVSVPVFVPSDSFRYIKSQESDYEA